MESRENLFLEDGAAHAAGAGPVAPTAAAAGSHQPLARAELTAGLLHEWQQRNLAASLPLALRRREDHVEKDDPGRRRVWFNCACCPPNIMRLVASLEHYLATEAGDTLYVHQYTGSRLSGAGLDVEVTTDYPWAGAIYLRVLAAPQAVRGLALRVPACAPSPRQASARRSRSPPRASACPRSRRPWLSHLKMPHPPTRSAQ